MAQPASVAPSLELTGRTVAERYVLTGLLGRGGFGTVYSGRDLTGAGEVAVKVFSRSEGFASRAAREARTATKLDHPNIHTCLGVEQDEHHAYLISRLVVGKRLDRSQLSDEEAVRAIAAVADALAHAHERGVVHRDVKPSNILIGDDGAIVLTDFGIARDEDARDQTLDERVLGTLSYMAPEQAAGDQATGATDVWAAALTLYEALTGANPFRTKSLSDLLERLAAGTTPLVQERPDLPRALSRIVQQALHRDPRRRPSAIELRDGLLAAMRTEVDDDDVVSAAHKREPRELPRFERLQRPAATAMLSLSLVYMLTAFPVYPQAWTLPLAAVVAALYWRWPVVATSVAAALCLPAFWNYSQAAALIYAPLAAIWIRAGRKWGARMLVPLTAIPLTLLGIGPAVVLVAATAPDSQAPGGRGGGRRPGRDRDRAPDRGTGDAGAAQRELAAGLPDRARALTGDRAGLARGDRFQRASARRLGPGRRAARAGAGAVGNRVRAGRRRTAGGSGKPSRGTRTCGRSGGTRGYTACRLGGCCAPLPAGPVTAVAHVLRDRNARLSLLRNIEQKISGLFEGVFSRTFRSTVQPVELARKLAKEMDDHKTISIHRVYVPDEYTVFLNPADREQFAAYETQMRNELVEYLVEHARREGYSLAARPLVLLETDDDLTVGTFGIAVSTQSPASAAEAARAPEPAHAGAACPRPAAAGRAAGGTARSRPAAGRDRDPAAGRGRHHDLRPRRR